MKRIICLTTGWALVLLTGCVTLSVYPYYNAEDVRFDPALLGVWVEPGKSEEKINEQAYRMTVSEKNEKTEFDARLSN
ncbi:MAG TPA: hypothetical protein VFZ59_15820 [Verrucomicrobiae bacterium]|nr:hypothetical protein [Verrucomicrobiae bacterium]